MESINFGQPNNILAFQHHSNKKTAWDPARYKLLYIISPADI